MHGVAKFGHLTLIYMAMTKLFGDNLRTERKRQGLTAEKLAKACAVSRSYIILIEGGKRLPGKKVLPKIAYALDLSMTEVLNWYLEDVSSKMKESFNL